MKLKIYLFLVVCGLSTASFAKDQPLRLGIARLTHSHVYMIFGRADIGDIQLVGIAEPDRELAKRFADQFGFSMDIVFGSLEEMIKKTKPEAVAAFGSIYEHLDVVKTCAPKGIHVMVEKPLAVNMTHANEMKALANKHQVQLLTNYETTSYPTNEKAIEILNSGKIGDAKKVIIRDGHKGPKRIGVPDEFLEWLIDPKLNGGGALTDFGCYGANLMTWMKAGEKPLTVTAVAQQLQPDNNPKVEDDATIIMTYPSSMALIEPSWNWPIGRKDMEIYGENGVIYADNKQSLRVRISEGYDKYTEEASTLDERKSPYNDPFSVLAAVVKEGFSLPPYDPYSLENNMIVVEILDAARKSIEEKRTITLSK